MKKFKENTISVINNIISSAMWELIRNILIPALCIGTINYNIPIYIVIVVFIFGVLNLLFFISKYTKIDFPYIYLKKEIYFEYCESFSKYNLDHKVKAMCNGVDRFYGRYTWDPKKVKMNCIEPHNSYISPHKKNDVYHKYDIIFGGRKYNIGNVYNVKTESIMNGEIQFPLFATTIITPTKLLVIHIKLPTYLLNSKEIRCVVNPSPSEVGIQKTSSEYLDENGEFIWKIKNPKLSYEYSIEWDFNEAKSIQFYKKQSKY